MLFVIEELHFSIQLMCSPPSKQEEAWLYTAKMAGYAISIVLLVVYILTIQVLRKFIHMILGITFLRRKLYLLNF